MVDDKTTIIVFKAVKYSSIFDLLINILKFIFLNMINTFQIFGFSLKVH